MSSLVSFLRGLCSTYELQPRAIYRRDGQISWPLTADSEDDLYSKLAAAAKFEALPKESSTLGNIIEVSLTSFLQTRFTEFDGVQSQKGTERGYPDLEISGEKFGGHHAVDIKVARRSKSLQRTQSRITLYTGNTYFRYPQLKWPSIMRPFGDYATHIDVIAVYTLDEQSTERVRDLELVIQESWKIASRERSSTTREYIGAVMSLDDLRAGRGEFDSIEDFYRYWRKYPFRIPKSVQQQLDKLLKQTP